MPVTVVDAIVPLKSLDRMKGRLAGALSLQDRQALMIRMFDHVISACIRAASVDRIMVVAGDDRAAAIAMRHHVTVIDDPGQGLNAAIAAADSVVPAERASIVLAADLPYVQPEEIDRLIRLGLAETGVVVAGTTDGGTGALLRNPGTVIAPAFGPSSCAAHLAAAHRAEVRAGRLHVAGMAHDLDRPEDLNRLKVR